MARPRLPAASATQLALDLPDLPPATAAPEKAATTPDALPRRRAHLAQDLEAIRAALEAAGIPLPPRPAPRLRKPRAAAPPKAAPARPRPARPPAFDYTAALEALVADLVARVPQLAHIDLSRVLVAFARSRAPGEHGTYARIVPLRFEGGATQTRRRGRLFNAPKVLHQDREMLYVVHFLMPRFADLSFEAKLQTIVHELYHISPAFNGDIRRFPGRNFAHGPSREWYNAQLQPLIQGYLAGGPPEDLLSFLRLDTAGLVASHGRVVGRTVALPALTPAEPPKPSPKPAPKPSPEPRPRKTKPSRGRSR